MANFSVGELRRSAVVLTFGPGAIVDMRSKGAPISGVHAGLEEWDEEAPLDGELENQRIFERRLCKKLDKDYFRLPPVIGKDMFFRHGRRRESSLLLRRFPNWLLCPQCSLLKEASRWSSEPGFAHRFCATCTDVKPGKKKVYVVPVRFVTACVYGHLDEFPWHWWVRHDSNCDSKSPELKFYAKGPGLGGLYIKCKNCNREQSMRNSFRQSALRGLTCRGSRPWLQTDDEICSANGDTGEYRVLQRGASNLYYPVFESALDIPPWTAPIQQILDRQWADLDNYVDSEDRIRWIKGTASIMEAARRHGLDEYGVNSAFEKSKQALDVSSPDSIRLDEYRILTSSINHSDYEFETRNERVDESINTFVSTVNRVSRLREVRVIRGFTRIRPPSEIEGAKFAPISSASKRWLPAIEIRGEGIFIEIDPKRIVNWSKKSGVQSRVKSLMERYHEELLIQPPGNAPIVPTPKRLLIHSISHLLMKQLTLECGYSSASLRERLYVDDEDNMSGILIYTGTSDSDGTLGGLQSRGESKTLANTLLSSLETADWCSSDPLCNHGELSSEEYYSIASCHGCLLVPETSCELHNRYLDRGLVVGPLESNSISFFKDK